mmetsp:Transcript_32594/g.84179  ORF Transcript_32594/g.84179 Transcript_32594/m.84179 type:complete len:323 (+) Transcript_32594:543-1511(+)
MRQTEDVLSRANAGWRGVSSAQCSVTHKLRTLAHTHTHTGARIHSHPVRESGGGKPVNSSREELVDEREDSLPVLGVVPELLLVVPMLASSPDYHLASTNNHEKVSCKCLGSNVEAQPRHNLKKVVGTRHQLEEKAARDSPLTRSSGPEVAKDNMAVKVGELAHNEHTHSDVDLHLAGGRCEQGVANEVGHEECKEPVVNGVAEQVGDRHGVRRETMDEDGLKFTLGKVSERADQAKPLHSGELRAVSAVDVISEENSEDGSNKATEVLNNEHPSPRHLRAEILEHDLVSILCKVSKCEVSSEGFLCLAVTNGEPHSLPLWF